MQTIKDLFGNYQIKETVKSKRTERGDLITEFTDRLNQERGSYGPLALRVVAVYVGHMTTPDLYLFMKKCKEAKSFTACFWYHVKPKKEVPF